MKYLLTLPALCLQLVMLGLAQSTGACADATIATAIDTVIAGQAVATSLDHPLARDVLLAGREGPSTGIDAVDELARCREDDSPPPAQDLARVAQDISADTAVAVLLRCLAQMPSVRYSHALFKAAMEQDEAGQAAHANYLARRAGHYVVLFVPGWGYIDGGAETGSDLAAPRRIISEMGFETQLVPLPNYGSMEGNAAILAETLREHLERGKRVLLASASSGGAAVLLALQQPDIAAHPNLAGWLNICGVLQGSPVVDRFERWPGSMLARVVGWAEGWSFDEFSSMSRARIAPRFEGFTPPPQLSVLNYIGLPFTKQVSREARWFHRMLRAKGPNDGLVLVVEALSPGHTIVAVGIDHFIREDPAIDIKTAALLPVLLALVENNREDNYALAGIQFP